MARRPHVGLRDIVLSIPEGLEEASAAWADRWVNREFTMPPAGVDHAPYWQVAEMGTFEVKLFAIALRARAAKPKEEN